MNKKTLLSLALLSSFTVNAQEYKAADGESIKVQISSHELTRVYVTGGRLAKVWASQGVLDIQPDKSKGEVYVQPTANAPSVFSFFVRDDLGSTYTLVAQQMDVPAETIKLKPKVAHRNKGNTEFENQPYVDQVKQLIKNMALDSDMDGFNKEDSSQNVPLWDETLITLRHTYSNENLLGEVYTIQNKSKSVMNFQEQEFFDFGDSVLAVSLEKLDLEPNETTFLYVVRRNDEGAK